MDFMKGIPAAKAPANEFDFSAFSINGSLDDMKERMLSDKFVMNKLAILGQMTVFYASPNAGKTLLTLKALIESIDSGEILGSDVFYINADDNHAGLVTKTELAVQHGFQMVAPGYNGFHCDSLLSYIYKLVELDSCHGKVFILDTIKKFTDLMDKKASSNFSKGLRAFVAKGGTIIGLAHVNKNKDADGKSVSAGTSDVNDDFDCSYVLEVTGPDHAGYKVVTFENRKNRGANAERVSYRYQRHEGMSYRDILDSVAVVDDAEVRCIATESALQESLRDNGEIISAIESCLYDNVKMKTEIVKRVVSETMHTRRKVIQVLSLHTGRNFELGHRWCTAKAEKNAIEYRAVVDFNSLPGGSDE